MSENKCPKCGKSYGSSTHAKRCRGLAGAALRHWRNKKNGSHGGSSGGRGWAASNVLSWIPINTDALPARNYADTPVLAEVRS
jgi:hypothetical protein